MTDYAKSARPAGSLATQEKHVVTVNSLATNVSSITMTTEKGNVITRKVDDKKNLEGVKAGSSRIEPRPTVG